MKVNCKIQYFKQRGKYYSSGDVVVEAEHMFQVYEQLRDMFKAGERPGLVNGFEFIAHVTTDHPMDVPHIFNLATIDQEQN